MSTRTVTLPGPVAALEPHHTSKCPCLGRQMPVSRPPAKTLPFPITPSALQCTSGARAAQCPCILMHLACIAMAKRCAVATVNLPCPHLHGCQTRALPAAIAAKLIACDVQCRHKCLPTQHEAGCSFLLRVCNIYVLRSDNAVTPMSYVLLTL